MCLPVVLLLLPVLIFAQEPARAKPSFSREIAPILFRHCTSCHRPGEIGPMAFTSYRNVRPWAKAIQLAVQTRTMPPWHAAPHHGKFSNDSRMHDSEIEAIVVWAKNGAPEGNAKDLPALPQFAEGWRIGKPDAVYSIAEYTLGSNTLGSKGNEEQATFYVDTNLKEDVWAEAVEILP